MRTLLKNFHNFEAYLILFERMPDVLSITKTHLNDEQSVEEYEILNYRSHFKSRSKNDPSRCGVAICVNDSLETEINNLAQFKAQVFESLFLQIKTSAFSFILLCSNISNETKKHKFYKNRCRDFL